MEGRKEALPKTEFEKTLREVLTENGLTHAETRWKRYCDILAADGSPLFNGTVPQIWEWLHSTGRIA